MKTSKAKKAKKVLLGFLCVILAILLVGTVVECFYVPHYLRNQEPISPKLTNESGEVRVMSANLRCWSPDDLGKKSWFYRAPLIAKNIEAEAPSVIGFQEVNKWQYNFLCKVLPDYDSIITFRDTSVVSEGCPIFFSKNLYNLVDKGSFWLSKTPDKMSKDWDSACYRVCSYAILQDKESEKKFVVFNTHLDHVSEEARIEGIKVVLKKIEEFGGYPAMLMGDFNAEEDTATYKSATEIFNDAKYLAEKAEGIHSATYQNWGTQLEREPIDYLMISKKGFDVESFKVVDRTFDGVYASDHFPIVAELELN